MYVPKVLKCLFPVISFLGMYSKVIIRDVLKDLCGMTCPQGYLYESEWNRLECPH